MRTIFMLMMLVGLMSTVGVYAAGLGGAPTIKTVGGTGTITIGAPTDSAITLDWNFTNDQVTSVDVSWTPNATSNYDLTVSAGGTVKSLTGVSGVSATPRVDTVLGFTLEADGIAEAKVTITQQ